MTDYLDRDSDDGHKLLDSSDTGSDDVGNFRDADSDGDDALDANEPNSAGHSDADSDGVRDVLGRRLRRRLRGGQRGRG